MAEETQQNKPHRSAKPKKQKDPGSKNPKASTFANPGRFRKQAARSQEVKEKRLHVPLVDRLPEEPPPLVVGVVGPPGVGKTTLIKSLIRRYTKQTLSAPTGPLTVVTSKRRRLTFLECPADSLASMIDVAKIVDIVLLMIDGNYGFEMETMEFLNVLSSTGMPGNVFGILTHLDLIKKQDTLRTRKKQLKHRFWGELYQGAKLFYLSGVVNGRYPDREVLNISRFLSVMKNPRPLVWRNSHPYCLADRYLDLTPPNDIERNPKCDRTVALYGYLRGTNFPAQNARVHIPGVGDVDVSNVEALPDPCPTPYMDQAIAKATGTTKRRRLGEKQRVIYAPMSDVGGVLVDKDAVYIDVKRPTLDREERAAENVGFGEQMVMGLQGDRQVLGYGDEGVRMFQNHNLVKNDAVAADEPATDDDEAYVSGESSDGSLGSDGELSGSELDEASDDGVPLRQSQSLKEEQDTLGHSGDIAFADSDSDIGSLSSLGADEDVGDEEDHTDIDSDDDGEPRKDDASSSAVRWKQGLLKRAQEAHSVRRVRRAADLARLLYDSTLSPLDAVDKWNGRSSTRNDNHNHNSEMTGEYDFFKKKTTTAGSDENEDITVPSFDYIMLGEKWADEDQVNRIRDRFTSARASMNGVNADEDADSAMENFGDEDENADESDEGDGEFEDLEAPAAQADSAEQPESLEAERERNARRKEELKLRFEEEDKEGFANSKNAGRSENEANGKEEFGEDEWYDAQKAKIQKQLDINRAEFETMDERIRLQVEGFKAGSYVRITMDKVPYEFAANFNPRNPIIIGGLTTTETRFGLVQVRIKRHRWHKRILKNNDPLIFSMGWRRFQTIPIYSISDSRTRNRMLKYTPEHMHCFGTFYGPLIAPNTGFCCVQSFSNENAGFRIAATGTVLNVDESTEIVKKLKLTGYPHKVYKNTAILRDMFASDLEVMKFKGGNIRTVSGIRGMIKGRAGNRFPEGYVRAGFEDKILKSDIVFLSTWRSVQPREFYMPMTNLLDAPPPATEEGELGWEGMRTTGKVRYEEGLVAPDSKESWYRPVDRPTRHFNPLKVPRRLASDLPFKSQIAQMKPQTRETYLQKRAVVVGGEEKKARDLMQKLFLLRKEKAAKRAAAQERRKQPHRRKMAENLEKKAAREKRERDEYWRREGKKRQRQEEKQQAGGQGSRAKRQRKS